MFSYMDFWTTFKIGVTMKSVRKIIKEMVEKYPNDMELGKSSLVYQMVIRRRENT